MGPFTFGSPVGPWNVPGAGPAGAGFVEGVGGMTAGTVCVVVAAEPSNSDGIAICLKLPGRKRNSIRCIKRSKSAKESVMRLNRIIKKYTKCTRGVLARLSRTCFYAVGKIASAQVGGRQFHGTSGKKARLFKVFAGEVARKLHMDVVESRSKQR